MSNLFESKVSFNAIDFEPHLTYGVLDISCGRLFGMSIKAWNRLESFFMGYRLLCSTHFLITTDKRNQSINLIQQTQFIMNILSKSP